MHNTYGLECHVNVCMHEYEHVTGCAIIIIVCSCIHSGGMGNGERVFPDICSRVC